MVSICTVMNASTARARADDICPELGNSGEGVNIYIIDTYVIPYFSDVTTYLNIY